MASRSGLATFRVAAVFLAVGLLFLVGVSAPLTDGDSAYYAVVSLRALSTGNWLTFRSPVDGAVVDKPPVTFWLMGASMALFGPSEFAVRIWHTIMALGVVALTALVAARLSAGSGPTLDATLGPTLSAVILSTAALFFYCGYVPQQDVPTLFFAMLALALFIELSSMRNRPFVGAVLSGAACGLGALTRGIAGAVYCAAPVAIYALVAAVLSGAPTTRARTAGRLHLVAGIAAVATLFTVAAAAVALPWFLAEYGLLGKPFADLFLRGNLRFLQPLHPAHPAPAPAPGAGGPGLAGPMSRLLYSLQYLPLFVVGFLPWSGLAAAALWRTAAAAVRDFRHRRGLSVRRRAEARAELFLVLWFGFGLLFPLLIQWRVIRYLLPALPPMAIMCARLVSPVYSDRRRALRRDASHRRDAFRRCAARPASTPEEESPYGRAARSVSVAGWLSLLIALPLLAACLLVLSRQFGGVTAAAVLPVILPFLVTLTTAVGLFSLLAVLRRPRLALDSLAVLTGVSLVVLIAGFSGRYDRLLPWRSMVAQVAAEARPGDVVVLERENPFVRYYAYAARLPAPARPVPPLTVRVGDPLAELGPSPGRAVFYITERDPYASGELERLRRGAAAAAESAAGATSGATAGAAAGAATGSLPVVVTVLRRTDLGPALIRLSPAAASP